METFFSEDAESDLRKMEKKLQEFFVKHAEKLAGMPPRRHMRFGIPLNVENVTEQARMVYCILDGEKLFVSRCFATHKEYEGWYRSLR